METKYYKLSGLKHQKCTLLEFWWLIIWNQVVGRAMLPRKSLEKNSSFPLLWWLLPVLGIPWLHSNLCLCLPMALFTTCLCLLPSFPLKRKIVIGFSIQTNLVWLHLNLIASGRPYLQISSHFQVPGGYEFWETLFNPEQVIKNNTKNKKSYIFPLVL